MAKTLSINDQHVSAEDGQTLLEAALDAGIKIPTLCRLEGLSEVGACRLCLVEVAGSAKLKPACVTKVVEGMEVQTDTGRLRKYRLMILELLFAERNHICAVCVAHGHCELQSLAQQHGMSHVRFSYLYPQASVDASHDRFVMDHNRCILCTRCVRVCDEVEGAHTWDVSGRGRLSRIVSDLGTPWGESSTCTGCGKCVQSCPTGALFLKGKSIAEMRKDRSFLRYILTAREKKLWIA